MVLLGLFRYPFFPRISTPLVFLVSSLISKMAALLSALFQGDYTNSVFSFILSVGNFIFNFTLYRCSIINLRIYIRACFLRILSLQTVISFITACYTCFSLECITTVLQNLYEFRYVFLYHSTNVVVCITIIIIINDIIYQTVKTAGFFYNENFRYDLCFHKI